MVQRNINAHRAAQAFQSPVSTAYAQLNRITGTGKAEGALTQPKEQELRNLAHEYKKSHPNRGYRKFRAWLRKQRSISIGRKKANRILREEGLLCSRIHYKGKRDPVPQPMPTAPNQSWQIDMTSVMLSNATRLFLVIIIDVFTRKIVGWNLSRRCRATEWTNAIFSALRNEFPNGYNASGLKLRSDNGCQPTSRHYIETLQPIGVQPEWTGYSTPESNAYVERVIRTIKEEGVWPYDWNTEAEASVQLNKTIAEYNAEYPHSALAELSPNEFESLWKQGKITIERFVDRQGRERARVSPSQNAA